MDLAWLLLLVPLTASIAIMVWLHRQPDMAMFAAIGSSALCFLITLNLLGDAVVAAHFTWLDEPGYRIDFSLLIDPLAKTFLLLFTFLFFFIQLYAIGAWAKQPLRARFFGVLCFLSFAVSGLLLAGNLAMLLFFSELTAWAVFLLLSFGPEEALSAGESFFQSHRFYSLGLVIGIITVAQFTGDLSIRPETLRQEIQPLISQFHPSALAPELPPGQFIFQKAGAVPASGATLLFTLMALGLVCGAVLKAAWWPYSAWLPKSAEASTPALALLTVVGLSGIFLLVRLYPLLVFSPLSLHLLCLIGAISALFSIWNALGELDLKKQLAWLSVSQFGLMTLALGSGLPSAAIFQALSGGLALCLLILSTGSFRQNQLTTRLDLSGRARIQPVTGATFTLGAFSLAGVPPLAGFFSNAALLAASMQEHWSFYLIDLLVIFGTSLALNRVLCLLWRPPAPEEGKESASILTAPLIFFSVPLIFGGISFGNYGLKLFLHNSVVTLLRESGELPLDGRFVPDAKLPLFFSEIIPLLLLTTAAVLEFNRFRARGALSDTSLPAPHWKLSWHFSSALARIFGWVENWLVEGIFWRGLAWFSVILGELFRLLQTGDVRSSTWLLLMGGFIIVFLSLFYS